MAAAGLPSLSQVRNLDTGYLRVAAQHWSHTADLWEQAFGEAHERISAPGGTPWQGRAAAAARERSYGDVVQVRGASDRLHGAAAAALRGDQQLQARKEAVLEAVSDARADGFEVGEDYSVTDRLRGGSATFRGARQAAAEGHASFIRHRVAALLAGDQQLSARINAAAREIDALNFHETPGDDGNRAQAVDLHTFKDAPNPEPDPPPGGWSSDPLMRAAQKIAYGHAFTEHGDQFSGMTKDQLAGDVYGMLKRSIENPQGLQLGVARDGAPLIYDPKTNLIVIRDPTGADCGTVFKPDKGPAYLSSKSVGSVSSFKPGQLSDGPLPTVGASGPATNGEPAAPKSPVASPAEPVPVKPAPITGTGGGEPGLPFGGGMPWDSPATGPHPVHPHHPGQHHRMPLMGELPDDYED